MKEIMRICSLLFLLSTVACSVAWSMDFVNMNNEQLFELRGAIQNAPDGEKTAYQLEWEKRIAAMSSEEKKQFAVISKNEEGNNSTPQQPFLLMGQGYEKQEGEGQVIFGGPPQKSKLHPLIR